MVCQKSYFSTASWSRHGEIYDQMDATLVGKKIHLFSIISLLILALNEVAPFLLIEKEKEIKRKGINLENKLIVFVIVIDYLVVVYGWFML